jgi:hypothetical protein
MVLELWKRTDYLVWAKKRKQQHCFRQAAAVGIHMGDDLDKSEEWNASM